LVFVCDSSYSNLTYLPFPMLQMSSWPRRHGLVFVCLSIPNVAMNGRGHGREVKCWACRWFSCCRALFKPEEQTVILTRLLILIELDFRDALNILLTTVSKNRIIQGLLPKKQRQDCLTKKLKRFDDYKLRYAHPYIFNVVINKH